MAGEQCGRCGFKHDRDLGDNRNGWVACFTLDAGYVRSVNICLGCKLFLGKLQLLSAKPDIARQNSANVFHRVE